MTFCLQMRNLFDEAITLSVICLLVASVTVANKCRTRMNNNETFEIKVSRTATKKSTHSFISQPHEAIFRKAIIEVAKMNTNGKQFLHEARRRKYFMV